MRRREFITLLGGVAFTWQWAAHAQQTAIPVIGYLSLGSPESDTVPVIGVRQGLSESGYVADQDVTIEYRWAQNQYDRLSALAADLVQRRVAVIVTPGVFSTLAAKAASQVVPIVFIVGVDPVQLHLVLGLSRPGGNLTGINVVGGELGGKALEMLHELLPTTTTVAYLENPRNPLSEPRTRDVLAAARAIGVEIKILHVSTEGEIDAAFASLAQARALLVSNDIFLNNRSPQLVALAARYAVPAIYTIREYSLAGGLMSYGYSRADIYRLAGGHVARILKGDKPADLPVIQTAKIGLVINLRTAKALGLTVPPTLLARADEVIE